MKQGHLGFTRGGRVSIASHLCCTEERLKSCSGTPPLRHIALLHRSVVSKKKKALLPQCVPSHCLFAITEGDVIAWHDEIVYVKVHFIQMCNKKKERKK